MTPEQIMAAFETQGPLPRAALRAAGDSREAMVPVFLERIDRLIEADAEPDDDDLAFTFIYHLLAEWRETRAYRPMARLLRRDPDFVDALMGDGVTETAARVMACLFDGDLGPIRDAVLDEDAELYVRGAMIDALVILALDRPDLKPAVADFLRQLPDMTCERTSDVLWDAWASAVAALGLADLTPRVRRAFDDGLIDPIMSEFADYEKDLAETLATGRPGWFMSAGTRGPITDTVAELSSWYCFSEAYLERERNRERREAAEPYMPFAGNLPFVHVGLKVGRNDPCPCGSGRKFKKCCLQTRA